MKFARYGERSAEKPALVDANGNLRDLSAHVDDIAGDILTRLDDLKSIDPESLPIVEGNPRLGACVGQTGKFICIGLNYADHAAESGMEVPPEPVIFAKYTSAICGPNDPIIIPRGSKKPTGKSNLALSLARKPNTCPKQMHLIMLPVSV